MQTKEATMEKLKFTEDQITEIWDALKEEPTVLELIEAEITEYTKEKYELPTMS